MATEARGKSAFRQYVEREVRGYDDYQPGDDEPGKASDYIGHLEAVAKDRPGLPLIPYDRLSGREQARNGNMANYATHSSRAATNAAGGPVVASYSEVCSGWHTTATERYALVQAIEHARRIGGCVVAPSADRLLRHPNWKDDHNLLPTVGQWEALLRLADGVPICTILHPDANPKRAHGKESKAGQETKGNKGGRGNKAKASRMSPERQRLRRKARRMHAEGTSEREIARQLNVKRRTARRWLSEGRLA